MEIDKVHMKTVRLQSDNGATVNFSGRVFSETSYFDEESGMLTRMQLYVTSDGLQVYSIISSGEQQKFRRFYVVEITDDICNMSDGVQSMTLMKDMLFAAVFGLCGLDPAQSTELRATLEETFAFATA